MLGLFYNQHLIQESRRNEFDLKMNIVLLEMYTLTTRPYNNSFVEIYTLLTRNNSSHHHKFIIHNSHKLYASRSNSSTTLDSMTYSLSSTWCASCFLTVHYKYNYKFITKPHITCIGTQPEHHAGHHNDDLHQNALSLQ